MCTRICTDLLSRPSRQLCTSNNGYNFQTSTDIFGKDENSRRKHLYKNIRRVERVQEKKLQRIVFNYEESSICVDVDSLSVLQEICEHSYKSTQFCKMLGRSMSTEKRE